MTAPDLHLVERAEIDRTAHYPETRKATIPGRWAPYCPKCCVAWPCPSAISNDGSDAA